MATKCYAMVRGSTIRATGLGRSGQIPSLIQYATSKSVARVRIDETTESVRTEMMRNDEDRTRLLLKRPAQTVRYLVSIEFLNVDPGMLSLVAGVPLVYGQASAPIGFGVGPFGLGEFGDGDPMPSTEVVGFDAVSRRPAASFGLEVWSKLAGQRCAETGLPEWGYTVFPFLKGGYLGGYRFENGLVSFTLNNAQARRAGRWGVGPHDLEGPWQRLLTPVSGNAQFRQIVTTAAPPTPECGIVETSDVIDGGSASMTTSDVIDGGSAAVTSPWIVEGGSAL